MAKINHFLFLSLFQLTSVFASNDAASSSDLAASSRSQDSTLAASSDSQRPAAVAHQKFLTLCQRYPYYFKTPPPQEEGWVDGININGIKEQKPQDLLQDPEAKGCLGNEVGELWWPLHKCFESKSSKEFFIECIIKIMIDLNISGFKLKHAGKCYTEAGWEMAISQGLEVIRSFNPIAASQIEERMHRDDYAASAVELKKELYRKLRALEVRRSELLGRRSGCAIQ